MLAAPPPPPVTQVIGPLHHLRPLHLMNALAIHNLACSPSISSLAVCDSLMSLIMVAAVVAAAAAAVAGPEM